MDRERQIVVEDGRQLAWAARWGDAYRARAAQLIVHQLERDEIANLQRVEGRRVTQIGAMKKDRASVPHANESIRLSDEKARDPPRRRGAGWSVGPIEFAGSTRHVHLTGTRRPSPPRNSSGTCAVTAGHVPNFATACATPVAAGVRALRSGRNRRRPAGRTTCRNVGRGIRRRPASRVAARIECAHFSCALVTAEDRNRPQSSRKRRHRYTPPN